MILFNNDLHIRLYVVFTFFALITADAVDINITRKRYTGTVWIHTNIQ